MNDTISAKTKTLIFLLTVAAVSLITYLAGILDWNRVQWSSALVFLILVIILNSFPVNLPRGGVVTTSTAAAFASILLFHPLIAVMITVLGDLFSRRKGRTLIHYVFNAAELTVSTGTAALLYRIFIPATPVFSLRFLLVSITSLIVYTIFNVSFVTLIIAFEQKEKPYSLWLTNLKWGMPNFLGMVPLGILIAVIYSTIAFWGLVLFLLPLALARQSFESYMNMRRTFLDTIKSLAIAIDAKDPYTKGHSLRVSDYAVALARELKWPDDKVELLQHISLIHDVGKIAVPEEILKKPSLLSKEELDIMKTHSQAGAEIIKDIKYFAEGAAMIRHHHERWDGTGYPDHIKAEYIPEGARLLAVVDAFDAMTTDRLYRKAMESGAALQELQLGAGTQFDTRIVSAFINIYPQLNNSPKEVARKNIPSDHSLAQSYSK
ncbi:MAG TPA: HD-GYP domain-containing protein [Candidatus Limnocylindrales bacterium]|nr:HD-GYP domain-containing protein [Candidatus Limnocylindrales bacterium]